MLPWIQALICRQWLLRGFHFLSRLGSVLDEDIDIYGHGWARWRFWITIHRQHGYTIDDLHANVKKSLIYIECILLTTIFHWPSLNLCHSYLLLYECHKLVRALKQYANWIDGSSICWSIDSIVENDSRRKKLIGSLSMSWCQSMSLIWSGLACLVGRRHGNVSEKYILKQYQNLWSTSDEEHLWRLGCWGWHSHFLVRSKPWPSAPSCHLLWPIHS